MKEGIVFIIEDRDIRVFSSRTSAEDYLEPWWVEERRGRVFDAAGTEYAASSVNGVVVLRPAREAGEALRDLLTDYFRAMNPGEKLDSLDLATLVERAKKLR